MIKSEHHFFILGYLKLKTLDCWLVVLSLELRLELKFLKPTILFHVRDTSLCPEGTCSHLGR